MKLLSIERQIELYNNPWDDRGPVEEYLLAIEVEDIIKIIKPKSDDPLFYDGYELKPEQVAHLMRFSKIKFIADFDKYNYVLTSTGIYDWSKKSD